MNTRLILGPNRSSKFSIETYREMFWNLLLKNYNAKICDTCITMQASYDSEKSKLFQPWYPGQHWDPGTIQISNTCIYIGKCLKIFYSRTHCYNFWDYIASILIHCIVYIVQTVTLLQYWGLKRGLEFNIEVHIYRNSLKISSQDIQCNI